MGQARHQDGRRERGRRPGLVAPYRLLATLALFAVLLAPGFSRAGELRAPVPNHTYGPTVDHSGQYKWYTYLHACTGPGKPQANCKAATSISGDTFTGLDLVVSRYGFQFGGSDHDVTLNDCKVTQNAPSTKSGDFPAGIAKVGSGVGRVTINNCEFSHFQMAASTGLSYLNGDGADWDNIGGDLKIHGGSSHDNSDGGYDLKGVAELWDTNAYGNYRNYRLWRNQVLHTVSSANPRSAHVWFGSGSKATIELLKASGDNGVPVFAFNDSTPAPTVTACQYAFSVPTKVFGSSVPKAAYGHFGPSCQPDAKGYAVNYVAPVAQLPVTAPPIVIKSAITVCSKTPVPNGNGDKLIAVKSSAWLKTLGLAKPTNLLAAYQATPACPFLYTVAP